MGSSTESVSADSWLSSLLSSSFPWLSFCCSGSWAFVQRQVVDLLVKGEPHVVQQLAMALEQDENNEYQFYCRILGRTFSSGKVHDAQELSELLGSFFGQTSICIGFFGKMENLSISNSKNAMYTFLEWPFERICSKQCLLTAPKESEQDSLIFLCQNCANAVTEAANWDHPPKKKRKKSKKRSEDYWDDKEFEEGDIEEPIGDFISAEIPPEVFDYDEQQHSKGQADDADQAENDFPMVQDNKDDGNDGSSCKNPDWVGAKTSIKEERPSSCSPPPEHTLSESLPKEPSGPQQSLKASQSRKKPTPTDTSSTLIRRRKGTFSCDLCGEYGLCSATAVMTHKRRVHMYNRFTCPRRKICSYTAHFAVDIEQHVRQHHLDVTELLCLICKAKIQIETYSTHYKECHRKREAQYRARGKGHFQCDLCGQVLSTAKSLENHVLVVHEKVKSYKCDECDYVVAYKQQLHLHKLKHHPKEGQEEIEKRHMCDLCGKYFQYRYYLEHHVKTVHMKLAQEFKCQICGIVTHSKGSLNKHIALKHSTKPESECPQCGKVFGTIAHMKEHMRSHEPPKFECETCGKRLKSEATLRDHMRLHTGEKPFKCDLCVYSCHSSSTLSLHKKFKHRNGIKLGNKFAADVKDKPETGDKLGLNGEESSTG